MQLSLRQLNLQKYYDAAGVKIFGPWDYTMVAPDSDHSVFITDEVRTIAGNLFGKQFDLFLRWSVVKYWHICWIAQLVSLPLGILVISNVVNKYFSILTLPGCIFPLMLLLRSHWSIMLQLFQTWEPLFLIIYSSVFCISTAALLSEYVGTLFIIGVIYPTLLTSALADASALRLDYAFIKGEISFLVLALPPYLISVASILAMLVLVESTQYPGELSYFRHGVTSTGFTLVIFLLRCIVFLILNPLRCVSLHAPMAISIVTLTTSPADNRNTHISSNDNDDNSNSDGSISIITTNDNNGDAANSNRIARDVNGFINESFSQPVIINPGNSSRLKNNYNNNNKQLDVLTLSSTMTPLDIESSQDHNNNSASRGKLTGASIHHVDSSISSGNLDSAELQQQKVLHFNHTIFASIAPFVE